MSTKYKTETMEALNKRIDYLESERNACLSMTKAIRKEDFDKYVQSNVLLRNNTAYAKDAYTNPVGQYGFGTAEVSNAGEFIPTPQLSWNFLRINNIYRSQPLIAKISNTWAYEQVKSGIDLRIIDKNPSEVSYVESKIKEYSHELADASNWGYTYGLSACVIMIDGQINETDFERPLKIEDIEKDSFLGLKTVVRWQGIIPDGVDNVTFNDIKDGCSTKDLGEPLYYMVTFNNDKSIRVHRTRLLIFSGNKLAGIDNRIERGCGVTLAERLYLPLMNYLSTINYVLKMLQNSKERVLYSSIGDDVALMSEEGQAQYEQKMAQIARNQDTKSVLVLSQDDEMAYLGADFANLDKIIQSAQEDLSASANMPLNKLFGKSPTGMNSSSKENLTDFYDFIERERNGDMRTNINKLIQIVYKSEYGKELQNYSFQFKSLWIPTEDEKALIIDRKMRPVEKAWESNAITLKQYLIEAQNTGKISDSFMSINDDVFRELEKNGLANARYTDMLKYVINGKFIDDSKEIRKIFKKGLENNMVMNYNNNKEQKDE